MKRRNKIRRHLRFPVLMLLALLCTMPAVLAASRQSAAPPETAAVEPEGSPPENPGSERSEAPAAESAEPSLPEAPPKAAEPPVPAEPAAPKEPLSAEELFSTCLLIGDSRTVGLQEYGGMTGATFFADVGLSSYSVLQKSLKVPGHGTTTLEALLQAQSFERIHLMLGINELGYDLDDAAAQYAKVAETIRRLQPEATLYLGANLHVDAARSARDSIYNNTRLNQFNQKIAALADGVHVVYLDVNPLFDDKTGALRADLTGDGTHVYGSVYGDWGRWLLRSMQEGGEDH